MRIKSICAYYFGRHRKRVLLFSVIVALLFSAILVTMMPFMGDVKNALLRIGDEDVVIVEAEHDKPLLTNTFGTSSFLFFCYTLLFAVKSAGEDRRYLLSNNITRWEYVAGSACSALGLAVALTALRYVIDLLIRLLTLALGFTIYGKVWNAQLVLLGDPWYMEDLLGMPGALLRFCAFATLGVLLFTRWKRTCIVIVVLIILGPIVATSFLPEDLSQWVLSHLDKVVGWIQKLINWYNDITSAKAQLWAGLLVNLLEGAGMYGLCYIVVRRMAVRSK